MKNNQTFFLSLLLNLLAISFLSAQVDGGELFYDSFDSYIAGQLLACQNPIDWTTWNNLPCSPIEDAYISTNHAQSPPNSFVVVANTDLVKPMGNKTSGINEIRFSVYVPSSKSGYFNTLAIFTPALKNWAMECYFYNGVGELRAGGPPYINFTFPHDTWNLVQLIVDLDIDQAQYLFNGNLIHTWQWTLGAFGGGSPLQLAAGDFNAITGYEMYVDDYYFGDFPVPVELTSFTAQANNDVVEMSWTTATELNNLGFEIQRSTNSQDYLTIGFVDGHGTTSEDQNYTYTDRGLDNGRYYYRLKQVDFDGSFEYLSVVEVEVRAIDSYLLEQNYPNPFNPSTTIKYSIPISEFVKLKVYDVLGNEVATLINEEKPAGSYEVNFSASQLSSGIYYYTISTGNFVETRKMILLR